MIHIPVSDDLKLPAMRLVRQRYDLPPEVDVAVEIEREWHGITDEIDLAEGAVVAVAVGSRGIANLAAIVRGVVTKLKDAGAEPFIESTQYSIWACFGGKSGTPDSYAAHCTGQGNSVHIKNTLELSSLSVSEGCLSGLSKNRKVDIGSESFVMKFDQAGNLK